MLKTAKAEFQYIQFWFTDQNNRTLEMEELLGRNYKNEIFNRTKVHKIR